jgi:hypothetical protein
MRAAALARSQGGIVEADGQDAAIDTSGDPEGERQQMISGLHPNYSAPRLAGNKLLVASGSQLRAFDAATGKPAWTDAAGKEVIPRLPDVGAVSVIQATDDLITVQIDRLDRVGTTYLVVEADTGKTRRQFAINDERAYWRAMSDDGLLFVVTNAAVEAFDLNGDSDKPVWRRTDLNVHYPAASQLSLDGLMVVNGNNEIMCLTPDGGEARWPALGSPVALNLPPPQSGSINQTAMGQGLALRSMLSGDMVVYESPQAISAYYTDLRPSDDGQLAWESTFTAAQTPPLTTMDISDPYLVAVASGPMGTSQHSMELIFINRKGGKRHLVKSINRSTSDSEAPNVRVWQLVDNGVALEVANQVYFYHGKLAQEP